MPSATLLMTQVQSKAGSKSASTESLEDLVLRLQARDETALEPFIARTEKACYRLALSILKDPDLSRDALQDSYLVVYQRIGQLREAGAVKSWLFRIVTHRCHDISRQRRNETQTDLEARDDLQSLEPQRDLADDVSRQHKIRATFQKLPEIDRTALALREVCSMSYEEMSQVLKVPLGTVRSRLAKARKRFTDIYKGVAS